MSFFPCNDGSSQSIGSAWNPNATYAAGQYVIYQNYIYRCIKNAAAGTAPTNATYWEKTNLASEITALNSNLATTNNSLANKISYKLPKTMEELIAIGTAGGTYIAPISWDDTAINPSGHNSISIFGNWCFFLFDCESCDLYALDIQSKKWVKKK